MVSQPGKRQAAFTAGEIDPLVHDRTELKYFDTGASVMENTVVHPQGGFRWRGGLRDIGEVYSDAGRLFDFTASDGSAYDLVFRPGYFEAWSASAKLQTVTMTGLTEGMLPEMTDAQRSDTMLVFHEDLQSRRITHAGPTSWSTDNLPYTDIPSYDYGDTYTNGVPAEWQLEFVGLSNGTSIFVLTVSQQDTVSIAYDSDMTVLATAIESAILDLPNISAGLTAVSDSGGSSGKKINIEFDGTGNEGDGWAISGRVINKTDAAILAFKTTPGVAPGEDIISATQGWPSCGLFYNQRLCVGGFKALPNAWMFSRQADYYNYDERFDVATGPAVIPMDVESGERILRMAQSRNLLIYTNRAEYWLAERGLSRTEAPNHVQASEYGSRVGVPSVKSEGGQLFANKSGGVIAEIRYTDVEGNFVSRDISLLGSHLLTDIVDMSMLKAELSKDGNKLGIVQGDGTARIATILREQDVTAFSRVVTGGTFKAVSVNDRNEMSFLVERPDSSRLERIDRDLLLDEATDFDLGTPGTEITGLDRFDDREIWVIGDDEVIGPLTVASGAVTLPFAVTTGYVGTWTAPQVITLPPDRSVAQDTVLIRPGRIHSMHISVQDTTSLATGTNGGRLYDLPLHRYGVSANVAELLQPVSGIITVRGLRGYAMEPTVTISQLRPGRLTVRSITIEAKL